MALQMLSDYVLVQLTEAATKTESGILLTGSTIDQPCTGTVISAGPGKHDQKGNFIKCPLDGGETVVFGKASLNQELVHEGNKYHVMRYEEIFAVQK